MSTSLKCPNPSCPYLFDPTGVPSGVVLTCPRCGMRFTLGPPDPATAAAPPPPPRAPASPPAPGPAVTPNYVAPGGVPTWFWVVMTVALLAGAGLVVYFSKFHEADKAEAEAGTKLPDYNLVFDPPPAPWVRDMPLEGKLGPPVILAYKRTSPEAFMAFGAKDYKDRRPRPSELKEGLDGPLRRIIQYETRRPEELGNPVWLGLTASPLYYYRAQLPDGSGVKLECHAVHAKGVGYWSICWAGETEYPSVAPEFEAQRARFRLGKQREQWTETAPTATTFAGRAVDYRLQDGENIWTEQKDADKQLPPADLHLVGKVKRRGVDRPPEAELWVYLLDPAGDDPLKQARTFVEATRTAELGGRTVQFKELTDPPEGDPVLDTVETPTPVVRLESLVTESRAQNRLTVVSALRVGNKVVAVRAECELTHREEF